MNLIAVYGIEAAVVVLLIGALVVGLMRNVDAAYRVSVTVSGLTFAGTFLAWLSYYTGTPTAEAVRGVVGLPLALDELNSPLVPVVALVYLLTLASTPRSRLTWLSYPLLLVSEAIALTLFACVSTLALIVLLAVSALPPYVELARSGKPTRVYAVHMIASTALLLLGWAMLGSDPLRPSALATVPLLLGVLVRCGTFPAHNWVTDLFEHATFSTALLAVVPVTGMYAATRIVVPIAPDWALRSIGLASLFTALYAAGMAVVQQEARRFFAYLFLSYSSVILVGLELHTPISLTGALALWFSIILSMAGLGLTLRALESRYGRLSLAGYRGLYDQSPMLAVFFLLTGLASVGFPGTLGFLSGELLVDGVVEAQVGVGVATILASTLCGIAVIRAYLALFTGARHSSSVPLGITARERITVLVLTGLILGGGLWPQPGVHSRYDAAQELLAKRSDSPRVESVGRASHREAGPEAKERPRDAGRRAGGQGGERLAARRPAAVAGP